ncbi:hypothetical protein GCM10018793_47450 [Streptomyces sulfonofaciens]|uniref:Uncharacterized protein n=1 Tax=Streptomyces sulfonofaciens TaxID=68272 RepID=A0A919GHJ9_9ACTN|nr:DNA primase [Streptomyces sulfonofaciens]GHH84063.1 hypothetical protein GCM10018793_47450 [Streptomyces sulfonofaciens]
MKLALVLGAMAAGRRLPLNPAALKGVVTEQLRSNPQLKQVGDQLTGELRGVGKAASGALIERRLEKLADRLHERTAGVREGKAAPPEEESDTGEAEAEEPEQAEEAEEGEGAAPDTGEDAEVPEEAEGREPAEGEEPPRPRKAAAKKAAKKAPAKKAPAKKAPPPGKRAAAKRSPGRVPPGKRAAAARGEARPAARQRSAKGGGDRG